MVTRYGTGKTMWDIPGEEEFDQFGLGASAAARTAALSGAAQQTRNTGQSPVSSANTQMQKTNRAVQPIASPSTGWVGNLNQLGQQNTLNNETAFWRNYGQYGTGGQPWGPGSNTAAFMEETFQPRALSLAANPFAQQGSFGADEQIMGMSNAADQILGGGLGRGISLDPAAIVGNLVSALAGANSLDQLMKLHPELAMIFNGTQTNPAMQVEAVLGLLRDALAGTMPDDMLSSWLATIRRIGDEFMMKMENTNNPKAFNVANWAKEISARLGPTLGL